MNIDGFHHLRGSTLPSLPAYERFCLGATDFEPTSRIWKSWSPPKRRFFLWLAALNRYWTAGHLARQGLEHPEHCLFCDQEEETIEHILLSCVFSREVWYMLLSMLGLQQVAPGLQDKVF
jgi:hypothetical protein